MSKKKLLTKNEIYPPKKQSDSLRKIQWEYMIQEVHSLEEQIHEYYRLTPQTMNVALIGIAAIITFLGTNHFNQNISYILLIIVPLILAELATYHSNVAAQAAAMSEQRDRLYEILNIELGRKIFLGRVVADNRRGPIGTKFFMAIAGITIAATLIIGWFNIWPIPKQDFLGKSWWFWGWLFSTLLTILSIVFSYR